MMYYYPPSYYNSNDYSMMPSNGFPMNSNTNNNKTGSSPSLSTASLHHLPLHPHHMHVPQPQQHMSLQAPHQPPPQQNHNNIRTLYYGNLPPSLSITAFLNHIKSGQIELIKTFPDKHCNFVTFIEASSALTAFQEWQTKKITIEGHDIKVGWGKPSPLSDSLASAIHQGASRNVFLGNLDETLMSEQTLRTIFSSFGTVEHVKILLEKRIAFVHLTSIHDAIKAVTSLSGDPAWSHRRIYYGKDRCGGLSGRLSSSATGAPTPGFVPAPHQLGSQHSFSSSGGMVSHRNEGNFHHDVPNRTIYLGGIHPEVTAKDLFDVVRGGILQNIKYMSDKNIAFVTFIDPVAAQAFYNRGTQEGISIKNKRVKFGWGKPTPLSPAILNAVQNGASRNVYIGAIDENITEERLRRDFSPFGDIELINMVPDRNIGFVNFTEITSAMKAVETMKQSPDYTRYKINFGKDRCGNAPRPSRQQHQRSPVSEAPGMEIIPSNGSMGEQQPTMITGVDSLSPPSSPPPSRHLAQDYSSAVHGAGMVPAPHHLTGLGENGFMSMTPPSASAPTAVDMTKIHSSTPTAGFVTPISGNASPTL